MRFVLEHFDGESLIDGETVRDWVATDSVSGEAVIGTLVEVVNAVASRSGSPGGGETCGMCAARRGAGLDIARWGKEQL